MEGDVEWGLRGFFYFILGIVPKESNKKAAVGVSQEYPCIGNLFPLLLIPDFNINYPKDPQIVTYIRKQLPFFRLPLRLNELDLCGIFFIECRPELDNYCVKKSTQVQLV